MASPSVAATAVTEVTTAGDPNTVNLPADIVDGSMVLIFYWSPAGTTSTWPTGWDGGTSASAFLFHDDGPQAGSNDLYTAVWRDCDGTEGTTISVDASGDTKVAAVALRLSGHEDGATAPPEASTAAGDTDQTSEVPDLTPSGGSDDYLWIAVAHLEGEPGAAPTYPDNYTHSQDTALTGTGGAAGTNGATAVATRQLTASSETGGVFTWADGGAGNSWISYRIAVPPSGGAPATAVQDIIGKGIIPFAR